MTSGGPWRLRVHEALPSTQELVVALAEAGEPEGLAVLARRQTAGRGKAGRAWESPAGNLHLTVLLRPRGPAREAAQWSLLAAVALADATAPLLADPARLGLKWPNDILLDGAKFAGVLAEAATAPDGSLAWLAIGIGANLAHAPALPDRPTAALGPAVAPAPEAFAASLLAALDRWRRLRLLEGFAPVRAAWMRRGPPPNAPITLRGPEGPIAGRFAGLGEDGTLLLACGGAVHAIVAGEVAG